MSLLRAIWGLGHLLRILLARNTVNIRDQGVAPERSGSVPLGGGHLVVGCVFNLLLPNVLTRSSVYPMDL